MCVFASAIATSPTATAAARSQKPVIKEATLLGATSNRPFLLKVQLDERSVRLSAVQASGTIGGAPIELAPASGTNTFTVDGSAIPRYVRVADAIGHWSPWTRITPQLKVSPHRGGGVLTLAASGRRFVIRGFDYQPVKQVPGQKRSFINETFSAASYSASGTSRALGEMARLGYNGVRVFVNLGQVGKATGTGLDPAYLARMAQFITTAAGDGIRVLLCTGELPSTGGYLPKPNPVLGGTNAYQLDQADIAAKSRYLRDLVGGLDADGAPLSDVLWELAGEQSWYNRRPPLTLKRGLVKTATGTYDMASPNSRSAMENDGLTHWVNVLSAELHSLVPGSLVGVGVYSPSINAKRPSWTVAPAPLFARSSGNDFVDLHVYSNLGSQVVQVESFKASATTKALIMGEFGAARSAFSTATAGAKGEVAWQRQSCHLGVTLVGWLLWTWNSSAQAEYWTAVDANEAIARAMSPVERPNACA
jgi:hypothetical protein